MSPKHLTQDQRTAPGNFPPRNLIVLIVMVKVCSLLLLLFQYFLIEAETTERTDAAYYEEETPKAMILETKDQCLYS